jgi:hypothetical protein
VTLLQAIDRPRIDPLAPGPFRYADAAPLQSLLERAGYAALEVIDWREKLPIGCGLIATDAAQLHSRRSRHLRKSCLRLLPTLTTGRGPD